MDRGQYRAGQRGPGTARAGRHLSSARHSISIAGGLLLACVSPPLPCRSPGSCPADTECLAQRCATLGADPVPPAARRLVLEPADIAVVTSSPVRSGGLPPSVTFGGPAEAAGQLLVRFGGGWSARDVVAAFLLLEPVSSAEPSAEDVRLEVAMASSAWSSGAAAGSVGRRGPAGGAIARTRPPDPLRVDVTAQLHELGARTGDDHGFVVRAVTASTRGAVYSTGAAGLPPRLDLYLRAPTVPP